MPLIELLIKHGANIDAATTEGDTSLSIAAESGQFKVVMWLVQCGAAVNSKRRQLNPTQWAIFRADPDTTQFLVSYGGLAKLDNKILWFPNQETLFQRITREFDPEIIKRLDLAIYRGGQMLRHRAKLINKINQVKWLVAPKYDPSDFSGSVEPVLVSFPGRVVQLISVYCEELPSEDDALTPTQRPHTTESKRGHA